MTSWWNTQVLMWNQLWGKTMNDLKVTEATDVTQMMMCNNNLIPERQTVLFHAPHIHSSKTTNIFSPKLSFYCDNPIYAGHADRFWAKYKSHSKSAYQRSGAHSHEALRMTQSSRFSCTLIHLCMGKYLNILE